MAKYSNLQAPVTNTKAHQRMQDTQALRARAAVGAAGSTPIAPAAQQTGAAVTQATGQQALQAQQQQAGVAKAQAGQVLQQQKIDDQAKVFDREQAIAQSNLKLDKSLHNISQEAANKEQRMRNDFANQRAQTTYLKEQELMDWALANSKSEQEFKDKIQILEQTYSRKAEMINHSFKVIKQDLIQKEVKAHADDKQKLRKEIAKIDAAWTKKKAEMEAEANNRSKMAGMLSTGAGVVVAGIATYVSGGSAAPYAPAIAAGVSGVMEGSGASETLVGG